MPVVVSIYETTVVTTIVVFVCVCFVIINVRLCKTKTTTKRSSLLYETKSIVI